MRVILGWNLLVVVSQSDMGENSDPSWYKLTLHVVVAKTSFILKKTVFPDY